MKEDEIKNILIKQMNSSVSSMTEIGYDFGLSLVQHQASQKEGMMKAESGPNAGITFTINMPL